MHYPSHIGYVTLSISVIGKIGVRYAAIAFILFHRPFQREFFPIPSVLQFFRIVIPSVNTRFIIITLVQCKHILRPSIMLSAIPLVKVRGGEIELGMHQMTRLIEYYFIAFLKSHYYTSSCTLPHLNHKLCKIISSK